MSTMSEATEYAMYRLTQRGDRKAADARMEALEATSQVQEFKALSEALANAPEASAVEA